MQKIIHLLKEHYPQACCTLQHNAPLTLLVSTILSAQATDKAVNTITPALFAKYPDTEALAKARFSSIEKLIHPLGLYKNKAKSIKNCCKMLIEKFNGEVPRTMQELTRLPGVGRKTANVVLGNAFGIDEGICVDTHVGRLSRRLGLSKASDPANVEQDLMIVIPKEDWTIISHILIAHGRAICTARNPKCDSCFLSKLCPKIGVSA